MGDIIENDYINGERCEKLILIEVEQNSDTSYTIVGIFATSFTISPMPRYHIESRCRKMDTKRYNRY